VKKRRLEKSLRKGRISKTGRETELKEEKTGFYINLRKGGDKKG